jgi:hypothetical protein
MFAAFSKKVALGINHTQVSGTQTNFPVLVSLTINDLKTVSNGGSVQNTNGFDIYFYSDIGLTTRLAAEVESYNASTGTILAWVKIPSISATVDTGFYIAYGDAAISTNPNSDATYGKTAVWDSNYLAVFHLGNGTSISLTDSTSNALTLTQSGGTAPTAVSGAVNGAAVVTGTGGLTTTLPSAPTSFTIQAWAKPSATTMSTPFAYGSTQLNGKNVHTLIDVNNPNTVRFGMYADTSDDITFTSGTTSFHQYIFRLNGQSIQPIIDGVVRTNGTTTLVYSGDGVFTLGKLFGSETAIAVDEVRFSNTVRSDSWLITEYNNQSSPSTFVYVGSPIRGFVGHSQTNYVN